MDTSKLLSIEEVASYFRVSTQTIRRWKRQGQFPNSIQIGNSKRLFWNARDISNFMEERES